MLADGRELITRAMLAATGMIYHEHPAPGVAEHTGARMPVAMQTRH